MKQLCFDVGPLQCYEENHAVLPIGVNFVAVFRPHEPSLIFSSFFLQPSAPTHAASKNKIASTKTS